MRPAEPVAASHPDLGDLTLRPYGQRHLLIDVEGPAAVLRLRAALDVGHPDLRARPGWSSLLVEVPPGVRAEAILDRLMATPAPPVAVTGHDPIVIDVTYDGQDLGAVADLVGLSPDEVIRRHTAPTYRVVFLGFTRSFPYLDGLDPLLATVPRLRTPRVRVAAGSVAIAAGQAGVYPMDSPGGWHVLGRTDAPVFDPTRLPPTSLLPGASVIFRKAP